MTKNDAKENRFTMRAILMTALIFALLKLGCAQTQEAAANLQPGAETQSAVEVSKQAANPLANIWLMQFQQNNNWIGMPPRIGDRMQSKLQFLIRSPKS